MTENWIRPLGFLTLGEARSWARRLRKLGFSPVTIHTTRRGGNDGPVVGYRLECNWPYDPALFADDLYDYLADPFGEFCGLEFAGTSLEARHLYDKYRAVQAGMGSGPIPAIEQRDAGSVPVTASRVLLDFDDWPSYTQSRAYPSVLRAVIL